MIECPLNECPLKKIIIKKLLNYEGVVIEKDTMTMILG